MTTLSKTPDKLPPTNFPLSEVWEGNDNVINHVAAERFAERLRELNNRCGDGT